MPHHSRKLNIDNYHKHLQMQTQMSLNVKRRDQTIKGIKFSNFRT